MSSSTPASSARPRPVYVGSADDGRLVPPNWLDQAPVTRTLLALNIAVFVVQLLLTATKSLMHLPSSEALAFGASYALATIGENRWETLVTACFLHDGIFHIGFNMLALWQAGPLVERAVGSARMAPMYLVAGAAGNLLSVEYTWHAHTDSYSVGASGAISGIIAAALIIGWRIQGWSGPLTQAMARWLGFVIAFGLLSRLSGGNIDNAAHIGGALAGGVFASMWRRGYRYSPVATRAILGACLAVLVSCIGIVVWHDRTDPFAAMMLQERDAFTRLALAHGRCLEAHEGLIAVERLRARMAPVTSLRDAVEGTCGHTGYR